MTCRDFIDFMMDYLSGELTDAERSIFDAHLAECPWCVAYLKTYQEAVKLGKAACDVEGQVPEDVPEELVQAILAARPKRS